MQGFKEILEKYGTNYEVMISRFLGEEVYYLRMLEMLLKDGSLQKLNDALNRKDMAEAFEAALKLIGNAGNLGLKPLYHAACEIVKPLHDEDPQKDYTVLYEPIETEFKKVEMLWNELNGLKNCDKK